MADKKLFLLTHNKLYIGNKTNMKWAWFAIIEILGTEDVEIIYEDPTMEGDDKCQMISGTYPVYTKAFQNVDRLVVRKTNDEPSHIGIRRIIINDILSNPLPSPTD